MYESAKIPRLYWCAVFCFANFGNFVSTEFTEVLLVDTNPKPEDSDIYATIEHFLPSVPVQFYFRHENENLRMNDSCAHYPELWQLQYHNVYWQRYEFGKFTYILHSAHYDCRPTVVEPGKPFVRILVMTNQYEYLSVKKKKPSEGYCQLWYEKHKTPLIVRVVYHQPMWYEEWADPEEHRFYPILLNCAPPPPEYADLVPETVSFVAKECEDATNNLRVIYITPEEGENKGGFAVCTPGFYSPFYDVSERLVEWLELLRLLGVEKVVMPDLGIHPNVSRTLKYYRRLSFLEQPKTSLPRSEPPLAFFNYLAIKADTVDDWTHDMILLTDCFYRNMYKYDYIAIFDGNEMIMPLGSNTMWSDIVQYAERQLTTKECPAYAGICVKRVDFPHNDVLYNTYDAPYYMHMMQHVSRVAKHKDFGYGSRCFLNTNFVVAAHNNFPMAHKNSCFQAHTPETVAQLQYYRHSGEEDDGQDDEYLVLDNAIWRYKDDLVNSTREVLIELGFIEEENLQPSF